MVETTSMINSTLNEAEPIRLEGPVCVGERINFIGSILKSFKKLTGLILLYLLYCR